MVKIRAGAGILTPQQGKSGLAGDPGFWRMISGEMRGNSTEASFGSGWVFLSLALAAHVTDEALTGFLSVYNPTVAAMRARFSWFPMPLFEFREWLTGLVCLVIALLLLAPFAMRGSRWMRPLAYFFAVIMILNGLGHTLGTVFGRTVSTVHFARPMPGFWSSPLLLAAGIYLLWQLGRKRLAAGAA
jgi:hypothetical protein